MVFCVLHRVCVRVNIHLPQFSKISLLRTAQICTFFLTVEHYFRYNQQTLSSEGKKVLKNKDKYLIFVYVHYDLYTVSAVTVI